MISPALETKHYFRELRRHWKMILISGFIGYYLGGGCSNHQDKAREEGQIQDVQGVYASHIERARQQMYTTKISLEQVVKKEILTTDPNEERGYTRNMIDKTEGCIWQNKKDLLNKPMRVQRP